MDVTFADEILTCDDEEILVCVDMLIDKPPWLSHGGKCGLTRFDSLISIS